MRTALREATELAHPMRIEDANQDEYDAVFYPGRLGTHGRPARQRRIRQAAH
jgi:hypothetical protein